MNVRVFANTCILSFGVIVGFAACGGDDEGSFSGGSAGSAGLAGSTGKGGSSGSTSTGGSTATSGGSSGSGGTTSAGGTTSTGGSTGDAGMGGASGGDAGASAGGTGGMDAAGAGGDIGSGGTTGGSGGTTGGSGGTTGGSGGAEPMCAGTAETCAQQLTSNECTDQMGCSVTGRCDGAGGCEDNADESSCTDDGCTWLTPCKALISNCSTLMASQPCNLQHGCEWNPDAGVAGECEPDPDVTPCAEIFSQATCTAVSGCNWTPIDMVCRGTATECSSLDAAECADQDGCSLQ